jgi:hypothetical protein
MNVTILGFGFSVTSPVAWMRLMRDLFGFLCGLASVKEGPVEFNLVSPGGWMKSVTGLWIFNDQL